jgi:outer membrane protein, heavy metal efflux system
MSCRDALLWQLAACLPLLWSAAGCRATPPAHAIRDPDYARMEAAIAETWYAPQPVYAQSPVAPELADPQPVETFVSYALAQNPDIHAARKQVEAAAMRVPQAASLQDPMLEVNPYLVPMQMGEMEQVIQMGVSQQIPWFGKLRTRAEVAEQETERTRAELAAAELAVIEQVKTAYYELYYVQRAIRVTEADRELLRGLLEIAGARFRVGKVSQQDVLRAELEVLDLENQLVRLRQELDTAQARLARRLHLSPETPVRALDDLPAEQIPDDVHRLYEQAIAARPELHAQLADVMRQRRNVDLARLDYLPDVRLSGMWMGMVMPNNGMNGPPDTGNAFMLGVGMNLPVYRQRLDAGVREAEARVVASARQYDSLRDQTQEEVKDLFAQIHSQQELLRLLREEIVPKADQTFEVSLRAYEVGEVAFLQLVDNWRQLLRFQISQHRLEAQLRQSLARLERVVGGYLHADAMPHDHLEQEPALLPVN